MPFSKHTAEALSVPNASVVSTAEGDSLATSLMFKTFVLIPFPLPSVLARSFGILYPVRKQTTLAFAQGADSIEQLQSRTVGGVV